MAMTPDSGDQDRDPRLDALYRAGSEALQPPPRLDDVIRAAARKAVHAGPRRSADRFRRWSLPLSLAAVIVLSVTVVTMMQEEGADRWVANEARQLPPAPPAVSGTPERAVAEPAPATPAQSATQQAPSPPAAPSAPAERQQAAREVASGIAELRDRERRTMSSAAEIAALGPSAPPAASAGAAAAAREERAPQALSSAADVAAREDQAPPAAAPPRALRRAAPAAAMADAGRSETPVMAKQAATTGAAAKPRAEVPWRDLEQEPVDKWLERLRELRRDGRSGDFALLVAEFRRRFPDAALPDDLR